MNVRYRVERAGLLGPAEAIGIELDDGSLVPVSDWRIHIVPKAYPQTPRAPWEAKAGLGGPYNAMVAPLGPLALTGIAWYQGENDAVSGVADLYAGRLGSLMRAWRRQFGSDKLPFLVVQLPEFGQPASVPQESAQARIREQQRLAVMADGAAALVPTIGLGEATDAHPPNKLEVGVRLARAAAWLDAGSPSVPVNGPVLRDVRRNGNRVEVRFWAKGDLRVLGSATPAGFETCHPDGSCRFVPAIVDRDTVVLNDPSALRVRYGWASTPILNLTDDTGAIASTFEAAVLGAQ
jgi:sialate O-acetylesterase